MCTAGPLAAAAVAEAGAPAALGRACPARARTPTRARPSHSLAAAEGLGQLRLAGFSAHHLAGHRSDAAVCPRSLIPRRHRIRQRLDRGDVTLCGGEVAVTASTADRRR